MPSLTTIPPYVVERPATGEGVRLVRPPHRMARQLRLILRFTGIALVLLAGLLGIAASRLAGNELTIALAFVLMSLAGGVATLWWMARSGGVHRIEASPGAFVLHRAGFAGIERRLTVERSTVAGVRAQAMGEARSAQWRLWLTGPCGDIELATLRRTADDRSPARRVAELLDLRLEKPSP